jgi:hypothetical protein
MALKRNQTPRQAALELLMGAYTAMNNESRGGCCICQREFPKDTIRHIVPWISFHLEPCMRWGEFRIGASVKSPSRCSRSSKNR